MKRLALAVLLLSLALAIPVSAGASEPGAAGPKAQASALYLTKREAKREIREDLRDVANEDGWMDYVEVAPCYRRSFRRMICEFYMEGYDAVGDFDYYCEGQTRVIEYPRFYSTRGIGVDCDFL